jgi:hypothetical protein
MWATFLLPIVTIVTVFTFVAVVSWAENRRKEREAYYRHELLRKMLESGQSTQPVLDLMREEERAEERRRIEGMKLGGLITTVVGVGLLAFLYYFPPTRGLFLVGLIPLLVGVVLALYGYLAAPRGGETRP